MNADDLNRLGMRGPVRELYLFMRKHGIAEVRLRKNGTECAAEVFMDKPNAEVLQRSDDETADS